jgi:hypothetical protein
LIKDLEKARDNLYQKQVVMNQKPQTESVEECQENNENLAIEWLNEESSKTEDFILVESRKKRRERTKSVMFSPTEKGKKIIQTRGKISH